MVPLAAFLSFLQAVSVLREFCRNPAYYHTNLSQLVLTQNWNISSYHAVLSPLEKWSVGLGVSLLLSSVSEGKPGLTRVSQLWEQQQPETRRPGLQTGTQPTRTSQHSWAQLKNFPALGLHQRFPSPRCEGTHQLRAPAQPRAPRSALSAGWDLSRTFFQTARRIK